MPIEVQQKIDAFYEDKRIAHYGAGEIIVFAGDTPPGVLYLQEGIVEQYDIVPSGQKTVVNIFKPPAFFPMAWAINRTPNKFFLGAATDVTVKIADPDIMVTYIQDNPNVMFDLLSRVYIGTESLLRRLQIITEGVTANRLIYELLIEAYRLGQAQADGSYVLHASQSDLAARCGLARETVNRELQQLAEQKYVKLSRGTILIRTEELEALLAK